MFKWFRKKDIRPEVADAYKKGQHMAEQASAELDQYMKERFQPVFHSYLGVLRSLFENCINPPKTSPEDYHHQAPPIFVARIDYKNFLEQMDELKGKMLNETKVAMSRWLEVAEKIGLQDDFNGLIVQRIDNFQLKLTMSGLELFTSMADRLKTADDEWRAKNPQLSAQFPADGGGLSSAG